MLALSRKLSESITCKLPGGDLIRIKVLQLSKDKVRLGISAPLEIQVHRDEVWQRIEEKEGAA